MPALLHYSLPDVLRQTPMLSTVSNATSRLLVLLLDLGLGLGLEGCGLDLRLGRED